MTASELLTQEDTWARLQQLQLRLLGANEEPPDWERINRDLRQEGLPGDVAAAITGQLALRAEASSKFGDSAAHMLFTRDGLEQATRFPVSFLHASRFVSAGVSKVADLGCGIGADAVALAASGANVLALDRDPAAVACVAVNLRPFPGSSAVSGDISEVTPGWLAHSGVEGIFLDPARRKDGRRLKNPEHWSPTWSRVEEIFSWDFPTGVKIAPGIAHGELHFGAHAQWISVDGDLVEASLWSATLSPEGPGRSALLLAGGTQHVLTDPHVDAPDDPERAAKVGQLSAFLYEPDASVLRSGTLAFLSEQTDTHLLHPRIAYLSGPKLIDSPFVTSFKTLGEVPLRKKAVLAALRDFGASSVEVKKRGSDIDPSAWQAELQKGLERSLDNPLVVFATRVGNSHRAIIAERVAPFPEGGSRHDE